LNHGANGSEFYKLCGSKYVSLVSSSTDKHNDVGSHYGRLQHVAVPHASSLSKDSELPYLLLLLYLAIPLTADHSARDAEYLEVETTFVRLIYYNGSLVKNIKCRAHAPKWQESAKHDWLIMDYSTNS
jgi:hypothetical protein